MPPTSRQVKVWSDRRRLILLVVAALLVIEVLASLIWPTSVPRLSVLPSPANEDYNDGCNDHSVRWERGPLIWGRQESSTLVACLPE
jgi:hypothetical protein